ncbi:MAG: UBP-type zinc finger domain-containing protein [Nitrososphaera sp.]|jgi:hypothetical protein
MSLVYEILENKPARWERINSWKRAQTTRTCRDCGAVFQGRGSAKIAEKHEKDANHRVVKRELQNSTSGYKEDCKV